MDVVDTIYLRDYGPRWDAESWLEYFARSPYKYQPLKKVFASTIQAVQRQWYETKTGKKVLLVPDGNLMKGTRLYQQEIHLAAPEKTYDTDLSVKNEDCLSIAGQLVRAGESHVAVLNMANRSVPGGGVYHGSWAQEEYCFRCSNYFLSLYQFADFALQFGIKPREERYPMDRNFGGVFSPDVTVFRDTEAKGYPFIENPWKVNFIAVAAINHPDTIKNPYGETRIADALIPAVKNKIRTIFNIAALHSMEVLVLGAHGCGAFRNPPHHIAELFREILSEPAYKGRFRKIIFAIIGKNDNFSAFSDVFSPRKTED